MQGTAPAGTETEQQASTWVRGMFGRIAPRYDLLNHLLSLNIDRYWRARTVSRVAEILSRPGARALDVCCGTGDLTLALNSRSKSAHIFGSDFCHPMLEKAKGKTANGIWFEADALRLPMADASLDLATIAFGFRNLTNYHSGLLELRRVLKPGGTLAILEFSTPPNRCIAGALRLLFASDSAAPSAAGFRARRTLIPTCRNRSANFPTPMS